MKLARAARTVQMIFAVTVSFYSSFSGATTCSPESEILESAEAVFSFIPMKGELVLEDNVAILHVEAHRVWRGFVNFNETIVIVLPRMLSLGDEFVVAANRDGDGSFALSACTPIVNAHRESVWIMDNLGVPMYEFSPSIFVPR